MLVDNSDNKQDEKSGFQFSAEGGLSFIEQLQKLASNSCKKEGRPYLVGVQNETKKALLTKPYCKMWDCEACSARNARIWIAKIINGCNKLGGNWSFLTITSHRKMRRALSLKAIRKGWKKLYNRILAEQGKTARNIHYCKVWEQHKDGTYHLHILIDICLGTRWAKDNCAQVGLGFQADWHEIQNVGQAAGYVAKYTLKNATISRGGIEWEKGLRRIETSRNWPKLPNLRDTSGVSWDIFWERERQVVRGAALHWLGYDVIDMVREECFNDE